jgi:hypothetical protein
VTLVEFFGGALTRFTFSAPVDVNDFDSGDWMDTTLGIPSIFIAQDSTNSLQVVFDGIVNSGDTWELNTLAPNVVTPQTGTIP